MQQQISGGGNTARWWRHDASSFGLLTGLVRALANQRKQVDWLMVVTQCFFLGMINGGNTMLLHLAGQWFGLTTGQTCGGKSAGASGKLHYGDTMLLLTQPQDGWTDVRQRQDWVWCSGVFLVVGGNTGHALMVTDKILMHTEIKKLYRHRNT